MAGGYQESHEVLRKHGGTVHGLTDRLQGVTNPSEWKTAPTSASYRKMSYSGFEMTSIRPWVAPAHKLTPKGTIEVWTLSRDPHVTVTYRPFSKSGGTTIDFNGVEGLDVKRLHIPYEGGEK